MPRVNFHLNGDESVEGFYNTDTNEVMLVSSHENTRNDHQIVENLNRILSVRNTRGGADICLGNDPFVHINSKDGAVQYLNTLTSFETRLFSRKTSKYALPFDRSKKPVHLKTDLHTHFAAALTPSQLIDCGIGKNCRYPEWLVKKLNLDTQGLTPTEKQGYLLDDLISNKKNYELLIDSMKIDTSEQETFNKMEDIYTARGPITKNPDTFLPMLNQIAKASANAGVTYLELSLSSIISDMRQLSLLEQNLPRIEKETGVTLRFLGALSRHSDKEWNDDEVEKLIISSRSPYIVGCDVMGHETNPTSDFYDQLKKLAKNAILHDPDFVIRVHAGENALFKNNVRQVLLAVEEAHHELENETGKKLPFPQVRIGHGLYGFDEPASWDESDRTKAISTKELFRQIDPIVEFNMSSNLSLNNIDGIEQIPIAKYIEEGVRTVLGTDGCGIYSTSIGQEMIIAHAAGVPYSEFEKIAKTEEQVIQRQRERFKKLTSPENAKFGTSFNIGVDQNRLVPHYTPEVAEKYAKESQETQERLNKQIKGSGAITDPAQIEADLKGKIPILLTGSSHKHFPKIAVDHPEQLKQIQIALDALVHLIDPEKAYIMTGGTNHGVERELHIIANKFNQTAEKKLVVLGTLTEEAAVNSNSPDEKLRNSNIIEANTFTHGIVPKKGTKIAKRWFDLPDYVLDMVQEQGGEMIAIGGGAIVEDMIANGHNMGLNMHIMSSVEGASKTKSQTLAGFGYDFKDANELISSIASSNPSLFKTTDEAEIKRIIQLSIEKYLGKASVSPGKSAENGKIIVKTTEAPSKTTPSKQPQKELPSQRGE